jgi:hypothetical protein
MDNLRASASWKIGRMEYWNDGLLPMIIIPSSRHSIIPVNLGDDYDRSGAWLLPERKGDDVEEETRGLFEGKALGDSSLWISLFKGNPIKV